MSLKNWLNQEWEMSESDDSVRRVSERFVDGVRVAAKGYQALDEATEKRRQMRRSINMSNIKEGLVVVSLLGTIAKFVTGGRR